MDRVPVARGKCAQSPKRVSEKTTYIGREAARRALVAADRGLERSGAALGRSAPGPRPQGAEPLLVFSTERGSFQPFPAVFKA